MVAAFLTNDNPDIFRTRENICKAIDTAGQPLSSRPGPMRVVFVTLGRMADAPIRDDDQIPLLDEISKINNQIPNNCVATIDGLDVVSTTRVSYVHSRGHVFLWPPIPFTESKRQPNPPKFITPNQRQSRLNRN